MAKKCSKCGFVNNPDGAHYCGKCGSNISAYGHVWKVYDSSDYSTYYKYGNRVISDSTYREYQSYEVAYKNSFGHKIKRFCRRYEGQIISLGVGIITAALGLGLGLLVNKCSSSEKKLTRIEVDGKYGIGYDKDNLLVPAKYDMIFDDRLGNQWVVYDGKTSLKGLAYVSDDVQNITDIDYSDIKRSTGHYTLLRKSPVKETYNNEYEYVAYDGKILNTAPFNALKCVGDWNGSGIFMERTPDFKLQLYSRDLEKIGPTYSGILASEADSVLVAQNSNGSELYDLKGQKLSTRNFYRGYVFSDGVGWAYDTKADHQNGKLSLIDKTGTILFNRRVKQNSFPVEFSDGLGWYKSTNGKWVAVDKRGMDKFEISAMSVYPFTMGIAPVYQGSNSIDRKLGFVDQTGKIVIPFKYVAVNYPPRFGRDSLMSVTLDGKGGKLHRNGTFYPGK